MRIKIYDKRLNDKPERRLKTVPVFFPKQECSLIAFVDWDTLNEMKHNKYSIYFTIKPSYTVEGENLYAVGFNRKNIGINDYDIKYCIINK